MSVVITTSGNFGPFKSITELADRLRCDDVELPFTVIGSYTISDDDSLAPAPVVTKTIEQLKAERQAAVDAITVTVDGLVFDGDETSQTRMARALVVMQAASIPTISWVLHDNTVATVTVTQLTQALAAAGAEQARLWVLPYEAVPA